MNENRPGRQEEIGEDEVARRKEFLQFKDDDIARLREIQDLARQSVTEIIEDFYRHLLAFPETRAFFQDPLLLERVKEKQKQYFLDLTRGQYGMDYVEGRQRIGQIHERIGLPVESYLGMYRFYLARISEKIFASYPDRSMQALAIVQSLLKIIFFDIGLALDTYIVNREKTIRVQQEAILELSTPVLQLREGLLMLPIVGLIDSRRARQLTDGLLHAVRSARARVVVLDITGVPNVDSKVANHLVQTVEAVRLMGATTILTGLSPSIARALVVLGVDLSAMRTVADLQGGIEEAERLLGYRVTRQEPGSR